MENRPAVNKIIKIIVNNPFFILDPPLFELKIPWKTTFY